MQKPITSNAGAETIEKPKQTRNRSGWPNKKRNAAPSKDTPLTGLTATGMTTAQFSQLVAGRYRDDFYNNSLTQTQNEELFLSGIQASIHGIKP